MNRELFNLEAEVLGHLITAAFEGIKVAWKFCNSWCTVA
jgi:hypothetical protein